MKSDNLLTYILYALLIGLIGITGYKACEYKKEKALRAKEDQEINQALKDLGYVEDDSTGTTHTTGSTATDGSYKDGSAENPTSTAIPAPTESSTKSTATTTSKSGIEGDDVPTSSTKPTTSSTPTTTAKKPVVANTDDAEDEPAPTKSTKRSRESDLDNDRSTEKYMVVTGSFTRMDNAREEMEKLVKQGYENAEVGKFNRGKFACAIAMRTNDLAAARNAVAALKKKGYKSAMVRSRK